MARARPLTAALWPRPYGSRPGAACVGCGRHLVLATVGTACRQAGASPGIPRVEGWLARCGPKEYRQREHVLFFVFVYVCMQRKCTLCMTR
jgi:hypothetical protein